MAKTIILLAFVALAGLSAYEASPYRDIYSTWRHFMSRHGKHYSSQSEEFDRLEIFAQNKAEIEKFNAEKNDEPGHKLAVNHMSDWSEEEFKQLLGFKLTPDQIHMRRQQSERGMLSQLLKNITESDEAVPDSVDWRTTDRVSEVKNQGQCGSCWAFSTVGLLEGQELPIGHIKKVLSLSAQNVMDCGSFADDPCNGGSMQIALIDVAQKGGVESDKDYPYLGQDRHNCNFKKSLSVIVNEGADGLPEGDEETLKKTVAKYGPVSVAIEVSDNGTFRHYKSGVYTDENCHADPMYLNHGVLVVGYGTDEKEGDYWIVKNSWDTTWGDKGYVKMARNKKNMCGIASFSNVATF